MSIRTEGDMLVLTIIGRKYARENQLLDTLELYQRQNFHFDGYDGPEYTFIHKKVGIVTDK
jgi:hypothetical protein